MWRRYTKTNEVYDGICIELDREAIFKCLIGRKIKFVSFVVDYIDKTVESIPYEYSIGDNEGIKLMFLSRLFATKTKAEWEDEEELRIILTEELSEVYWREELDKICFKRIYLGNEMTTKQRNNILRIVEEAKYKMGICNYDKTLRY